MLGNPDQYGHISQFSLRRNARVNYGAPQELRIVDKNQTNQVSRVYYGVPGQGVMGNPSAAPECHNWYLVARKFCRVTKYRSNPSHH